MNTEKLRVWDTAKHLKTPEDIMYYLEACFEDAGDDPAFITEALSNVARSRGMAKLSQATGLSRESLHAALSGDGSPSFDTVLKVIKALGLELRFEPATGSAGST